MSPMISSLLYFFLFSSWGLGLLSLLSLLSYKVKSMSLDIESKKTDLMGKQAMLNRMSLIKPNKNSLPEELKNLMSRSPDHPEVNEIEEGDEVYGVIFKAHSYPPEMDAENDSND